MFMFVQIQKLKQHIYSVIFAIGNISWGWTPPQFFFDASSLTV